jgi:hypothetical protein
MAENPNIQKTPVEILAEAADHLYEACELYEDADLDPDDHMAVIKRAYSTSDCDDFAWMVHLMTDWQVVRAVWPTPDGMAGHHSLVRAPDGRLFDVGGWTDEAKLTRKYLSKRGVAAGARISLSDGEASPLNDFNEVDDATGLEEGMVRLASVIRALPHAPFGTRAFRALANRPIEGVDLPLPDEADEPAEGTRP